MNKIRPELGNGVDERRVGLVPMRQEIVGKGLLLSINHDRVSDVAKVIKADDPCILKKGIVGGEKMASIVQVWIPFFKAGKWNHTKRVFKMESSEKKFTMFGMVRGIHCNNPCISSEVEFFGWSDDSARQGKTIKAIKLANHSLAELFTIDEVGMLLVNPCCFQNVCGRKVLKFHVNVMSPEVEMDAVLNAKHLVRRNKPEVDNGEA